MARLQTTGYGSIIRKRMESVRICERCGSDDLKYDRFYAICNECGYLMPKKVHKTKENKAEPLFKNEYSCERIKYDGKTRGTIVGDKYVTHRTKIHFVKKYVGFGITEKIFNLIKKRVKKIAIIYTKEDGTQEVYYSSIETWEKFGIKDRLGMNERQIFLPIKYMKVEG